MQTFLILVLAFFVGYLYKVLSAIVADKYPTTLYVGRKGSGKSLALASKINKTKAVKVYSNFGVGYPLSQNYWLDKIEPNSLVLIDEAGIIHDNRQFKSFPTGARDFFKYARKRKIEIVLASQSVDIDKKIRDILDEIIVCEKAGNFLIKQRYKHKVTTVKDADGNSKLQDVEVKKGLPSFSYLPKAVTKALYDTTQEITSASERAPRRAEP